MEDHQSLFIELHKLNDDYHGKKEQMVWVVSTSYYGFGAAALAWLSSNTATLNQWRWFAACALGAVCLLCGMFVFYQNSYKVVSTVIANQMNAFIPTIPKAEGAYERLQAAYSFPKNLKCSQKATFLWRDGKTGLMLVVLIMLFGAAQVILFALSQTSVLREVSL